MLGIIGLGRMGMGLTNRLLKSNKKVVVYNRSHQKTDLVAKKGAIPSYDFEQFFAELDKSNSRRIIWVMLPDDVLPNILPELEVYLMKGDILIDGGNSNFNDSKLRYDYFFEKGISFLDIGVSGGLFGEEKGYCMMVGGDKSSYDELISYFDVLCKKDGFGYMGSPGSGHFVKMVHNSIEYGMMQSFAEGFNLLRNGPFNSLDIKNISDVWSNGSIISSFLLDMASKGFNDFGVDLREVGSSVDDNGEGRWAVKTAIDSGVPFTANSFAVFQRFTSKGNDEFANQFLSALRKEFGGHSFERKS